ncbi:hypothetical protein [Halopseudomonas sp.]
MARAIHQSSRRSELHLGVRLQKLVGVPI